MLWVDKHRPTSLDKLDYHKEQAAQLARTADDARAALSAQVEALQGELQRSARASDDARAAREEELRCRSL